MEVTSLYREPPREQERATAAVEFLDVFRIYRSGPAETVALRGLDLRIEAGEFVAVLGPSGSGKSTFLSLAAGLEQPSAGEVRVFGQPLDRLDEAGLAAFRARRIAIIFQSDNLLPLLTARENVATAVRLGHRPNARSLATTALGTVDLAPRVTHRPASPRAGRLSSSRTDGTAAGPTGGADGTTARAVEGGGGGIRAVVGAACASARDKAAASPLPSATAMIS